MILGNTNSVAENLYYLLWIKDSGLQESKFPFRIPDTILISGRQITNWYFSGSSDLVLKKKVNHLNPQSIFDSMTKSNRRSDIVAQIIYSDKKGEKLTKIQQKAKQLHLFSADEDEKVVVKYLNKKDLHKFLFEELNDQDLDETLILQRFIDPYGDSNNCIQAIWSPSTCFFTRRINNRHLTDTLYDPYERAVTFDGPEIFSKAVCLKGKQISGEIRRLSENIVKRIAHVTYERTMINRMTLYFKADFNNQLYFLYCTSLRLKDEIKNIDKRREKNPVKYKYNNTPLLIDNNYQRPPNMKNIYTVSTTQPLKMENDLLCLNCEQMYQHQDMMEIPFTYLMRNNEVFDNKNFKFIKNAHNTKLNSKLSTGSLQNQLSNNNLSNNTKKNKLVEVILTNKQIMEFLSQSSAEEPFNFEKAKSYVDANQAPPHPLLAKLYPKMTKENYAELKEKGNFDSLYIKLCHNCYYSYTQNSVITGAPLSAVVNLKEINKNRTNQISNLFTPEMHRIALEKNYELSKEFDFVRYQKPEIYEQRLELLSRDEYFKQSKPKQSTQLKQQTIKQKTQKQNIDNSKDFHPEKVQPEQIQSDQQDIKVEDDNDQYQINIKGLLLKQQQKQEHSDIEKMYFNKKDRPHTTKAIKSTLLDNTEKFSKRFDLLLNLAEKSILKQKSLNQTNNQKDLKGSDQQLTDREKYYSSNAHSSKQTDETNDDSFSKKKNSILEIYLNNYDQKSQQKQQETRSHGINNPINIQQQEIASQSSFQLSKQQTPFLKRSYTNSKNEITTGNFSASSYHSNYTSVGDNSKEKFIHKSPSSQAYLTSTSYSRRRLSKQQNTNSSDSGMLDFLNKSPFNRPNTTQNVFRLSTIKEDYGINVQKTQKSPYLPNKQQNVPNKQNSVTDRIQILKEQNLRLQKNNEIKQTNEENKQSNNRFQKSYTSQSSRQKILVNIGPTKQSSPVNNIINTENSASKTQDDKKIYLQQGYQPTDATYQQTDSNFNQSNHKETQHKTNIEEQNINSFQTNSDHKLFSQRTDGDNQPVKQIQGNQNNNQHEYQEQEKHEKVQNNDNMISIDNEKPNQNNNITETENIQKHYFTDEGYQKEMQNIIEDYQQQKE